MTLCLMKLLVVIPRYMPPELTSSLFGEKMTQAIEAIISIRVTNIDGG